MEREKEEKIPKIAVTLVAPPAHATRSDQNYASWAGWIIHFLISTIFGARFHPQSSETSEKEPKYQHRDQIGTNSVKMVPKGLYLKNIGTDLATLPLLILLSILHWRRCSCPGLHCASLLEPLHNPAEQLAAGEVLLD